MSETKESPAKEGNARRLRSREGRAGWGRRGTSVDRKVGGAGALRWYRGESLPCPSGAGVFVVCGFVKRPGGKGNAGRLRSGEEVGGAGELRRLPSRRTKETPRPTESVRGRNGKDLGGCARGGGACATCRSIRSGPGDPRALRRRSDRTSRCRPSCWRCPS